MKKRMGISGSNISNYFNLIKVPLLSVLVMGTFINNMYSQPEINFYVVDEVNENPVQFAHIIDKNGNVITVSDYYGHFSIGKNVLTSLSNVIFISHISYYEQRIRTDKLSSENDFIIRLQPGVTTLPGVVIKQSKNKKKDKTYYVLSSYFRGWQIEEGILKYYYDGLVDYIIPINENKKYQYFVKQYRVFKNDSLIDLENKKAVSISIGFGGVPGVWRSFSINDITKFTKLLDCRSEDTIKYILQNITDKGEIVNVGTVITDTSGTVKKFETFLDRKNYYFDEPINLLGHNWNEVERYNSTEYAETNNVIHEKYEKSFYKVHFKKKKEKQFKLIENHKEYFILNFRDDSDKGLNKMKRNKSYFSEDYLQYYEQQFPIPSVITSKVNSTLTMSPNNYKDK